MDRVLGLADERQRRLVLDSLLLGVVGTVAAQLFTFMVELTQTIFLEYIADYQPPGLPNEGGSLEQVIGANGVWLIPVVTTLGGLLAGLLVFSLAPEAEGHGTDSAVKAFHRAGGFLRGRVPPLKMVASAITIGSGGVAGREGPTALIAAGIGSVYATWQHRPDDERRLLILIGMAAGLSAIFRTPIGAAIFAIEVLYSAMEFEAGALLYALLASVVAYTLTGMIDGWEALFMIPANLSVEHAYEYLEYAVLGVMGGAVAAVLPTVFYGVRDLFHRIPLPPHVKPALGGLGVGLIALELPEIIGGGYGWLQRAINGDMTLDLLISLLVIKIFAMSLTVSSGGSGGVFAPTLFIGGMLGGVLADLFGQDPAAFVVVGMAAVFSGAGRVPLATMFMVTEMTGGYHLLAPTALVVTLSYIIQITLVSRLRYTSLYEAQIPLRPDRDVDLFEGITVADVLSPTFDTVPHTLPLTELVHEFERTHHHGFVVTDDDGKLFGVVTVGDLERAMLSEGEHFKDQRVAEIATTRGLSVGYPDEPMSAAVWRIGARGIGRLPIVARDDPRHLLGVIRRRDVVRAYEHVVARRKEISSRLKELRESHEGNVRVVELDIPPGHRFEDRDVSEIAQHLPADCILASIRRDNRVIIPHGDTVIRAGDHIITLASTSCEVDVRAALGE